MTEHTALELTAEEASRRIAADIRAYPQSASDKRGEHLRLFGVVLSHEEIEGAWADRYAEIALAGRGKLADLSSRLGALRPKIDEAKRKLEQSKVIGFRRFAKKEQADDTSAKSTKTIAAEIIRREFGNAVPKPEEEPEELEPELAPEEAPRPTSSLHQLYLPGVAGEVQDYFLTSAMQPSHIMSLGVGLMVPTVLVSGYVFGPSGPKGCALQQTVVIVGPTSSGKQGAMDITKECVFEAGEGARALNPKSNPCEVEINDRMREFWAIGPGGIYNSPHGASKLDDSEMIVDPRLSIFGFGVHQEFYEACQIEDISNGFLNRIIVLDEPVALYPKTDIGPSKVGYDLKLNLEKLYGIKTSRRLDWTPAAKEVYDAEVHRVFTETDDRRRKLWSRTPEKIVRAASTFAASRFATKVERSDMEIAQVIMRHSDEVFRVGIDAAQKNRRLDHANIKLEIIRRLKVDFRCYDTDDNGKPIIDAIIYQASDFEIRRSFRHNSTHKKAVPDAVDDLLASGTLRRLTIKTGGRNKVVNRLMEE